MTTCLNVLTDALVAHHDEKPARMIAPELAGGRLTIDLDALVTNWKMIGAHAPASESAGVLKANAYGLGMEPVASALWKAGCRTFFVALAHEGVRLRAHLPDARIFFMGGLFPDSIPAILENRLIPLLGSRYEMDAWRLQTGQSGRTAPCGLQIDTGMNRLGVDFDDCYTLISKTGFREQFDLKLVMSHLCCADEADHPKTALQRERFVQIKEILPGVPASLANSAGVFLGPDYHFDIIRPGIGVYGGRAVNGGENPFLPVAQLEGRIVQVRTVKSGETIGYGGTYTFTRDSKVAMIAVGYGDGYPRAASGSGVAMRYVTPGPKGFLGGYRIPVVGRISMDITALDVTDLPDGIAEPGRFIELFGPNMPLDAVADACGTIGYELLTSLGGRPMRTYGKLPPATAPNGGL